MTQYTISGRTYEQRELFKSLGGEWDGIERVWTLNNPSDAVLARLRSTPGIGVTERSRPKPTVSPEDWFTSPTVTGDPVLGVDWASDDPADILAALMATSEPMPITNGQEGRTTFVGNDRTYFNAFRSKNPTVFAGFRSLGDFADWIEQLPADHQHGNRGAGWETHQPQWSGTPNMRTALNRARLGWRDGTERAREALELLQGEAPLQRHRRATVAGGRVNVGRMLSGSPVHMIHRPKQPGSKVITLFVETSLGYAIKAENIIIFAALVAAICDVLESHDYACEIVALDTTRGSYGPACQMAVVLKQAGQTLNLSDVVFGLGHPSFQRRMVFALCSIRELRSIWSTMGSPDVAFDKNYAPEPGSFYLPTLDVKRQNAMKGDFAAKCRALFPLIVPDGFPVELSE